MATQLDPGWLVKDFNVLYRAAQQVLTEAQAAGEMSNSLVALQLHVTRLAPAFDETETVRRALWADANRGAAIGMPTVANQPTLEQRMAALGLHHVGESREDVAQRLAPLDPPMTPAERYWAQSHGAYQAPEMLTPRGAAVLEAWRQENPNG